MIRLNFPGSAVAALVLVATFVGGKAHAETYTLAVPPQYDEQWGLCDFRIISTGTASVGGSTEAEMEQEQSGISSLTCNDSPYTVTWRPAEGGGSIEVETPFRNKFWARIGLCYWTEGNETRLYEQITGDLVGGSMNEAELAGPYDTPLRVMVELCGGETDLSEVERIQGVIAEAVSSNPDSLVVLRSFDTNRHEERTEMFFSVNRWQQSHRVIADRLLDTFTPAHPVHAEYGNRMLYVGDCDQTALFFRVEDVEGPEDGEPSDSWGHTYTSASRIFAIQQDDGNTLVTYLAEMDTVTINLFGYSGVGTMAIQPVPETGSDGYFRATFVLITQGGEGMTINDMVRSVSGTITLTEGATEGSVSGRFEGIGYSVFGPRRSITGGFRNVPFPQATQITAEQPTEPNPTTQRDPMANNPHLGIGGDDRDDTCDGIDDNCNGIADEDWVGPPDED